MAWKVGFAAAQDDLVQRRAAAVGTEKKARWSRLPVEEFVSSILLRAPGSATPGGILMRSVLLAVAIVGTSWLGCDRLHPGCLLAAETPQPGLTLKSKDTIFFRQRGLVRRHDGLFEVTRYVFRYGAYPTGN